MRRRHGRLRPSADPQPTLDRSSVLRSRLRRGVDTASPLTSGRVPMRYTHRIALALGIVAIPLAISGPASSEARETTAAVHANVLVRIDPATNRVTRVVEVGSGPAAAAVGGRDVWVYSDADRTVWEIDASTGATQRSTVVSARPVDLGYTAGPV